MFTVKMQYGLVLLEVETFKNISCLRLRKYGMLQEVVILEFKNISCLRLRPLWNGNGTVKVYLKTFHVYG